MPARMPPGPARAPITNAVQLPEGQALLTPVNVTIGVPLNVAPSSATPLIAPLAKPGFDCSAAICAPGLLRPPRVIRRKVPSFGIVMVASSETTMPWRPEPLVPCPMGVIPGLTQTVTQSEPVNLPGEPLPSAKVGEVAPNRLKLNVPVVGSRVAGTPIRKWLLCNAPMVADPEPDWLQNDDCWPVQLDDCMQV